MPATDEFVQDVTRPSYLGGIRSNQVLDPEAKQRLEQRYLDSFGRIDAVRQANTRARLGELAIERDRFQLDRARTLAAREDEAIQAGADTDSRIAEVVDNNMLTPEEKRAQLVRNQIAATGGNKPSYIAEKWRLAQNLIPDAPKPEPGLTPIQIIGLSRDGVPDEIMATGDLGAIGRAAQEIQARKDQTKLKTEAEEKAAKDLEDRRARKTRLLDGLGDIEFGRGSEIGKDGEPVADPSKFAKDISRIQIKRILAMSDDPELRKIGQTENNATKLKEALEREISASDSGSGGTKLILPKR